MRLIANKFLQILKKKYKSDLIYKSFIKRPIILANFLCILWNVIARKLAVVFCLSSLWHGRHKKSESRHITWHAFKVTVLFCWTSTLTFTRILPFLPLYCSCSFLYINQHLCLLVRCYDSSSPLPHYFPPENYFSNHATFIIIYISLDSNYDLSAPFHINFVRFYQFLFSSSHTFWGAYSTKR